LNRNACEQAIFRAKKAEQIIWVAPGVYALAPPKPPPRSLRGHTDDEWIARIKAWQANPASWKIEEDGPPPNNPNHRIPQDVVGQFKDRQKREREKAAKQDAEAAAARQAAADRQLRDQLLAATGGNYTPGPALDDVAPIKMALEIVPLDDVLSAIRGKSDRKLYPRNEPASSWRDPRLLKAIAEHYCRFTLVPSIVHAWSAVGTVPQKPADASSTSPSTLEPEGSENAPAPSPPQPETSPNDEPGPMAATLLADYAMPDAEAVSRSPLGESTRDSILAAFARNRVPPQPVPQPQPSQPRPPQRQAEREPISEEGWEEIIAGFMAGMVHWNVRRLGPEPGHPDCRAPRNILRSFGLA
jgi:hypothetical protein